MSCSHYARFVAICQLTFFVARTLEIMPDLAQSMLSWQHRLFGRNDFRPIHVGFRRLQGTTEIRSFFSWWNLYIVGNDKASISDRNEYNFGLNANGHF